MQLSEFPAARVQLLVLVFDKFLLSHLLGTDILIVESVSVFTFFVL